VRTASSHLLFALLLAWTPACARTAPTVAPAPPVAADPLAALRAELDHLFLEPAYDHALWGVKVQSMDSGQILYELNPSKLMMPASNMKIVTMAAAAERLGWDYRFETRLATSGHIESGVLHGDLIVQGTGDPTIGAEDPPDATFIAWADRLIAEGIQRIDGRIIGDDNAFDDEGFGAAWSWDDIPFGYAAQSGALQFHQGIVELTINPGAAVGDAAGVSVSPPGSDLVVHGNVITGAPGDRPAVALARLPTREELDVRGTVPLDGTPIVRTASAVNPTRFFVRGLRAALIEHGVEVQGEAVDIDDIDDTGDLATDAPRVLVRHQSATLAEIGRVLMKDSQNLYAETLLKALGRLATGLGTARAGREVVSAVLSGWGIPETEYVMYDGSGLSRNNYVTPDMLITLLRVIHRGAAAERFLETLPIGGVDGTLERRLVATRAAGRVRAKTGSIANTRALSGYLPTADDEILAFSIIANHFRLPPRVVLDRIDLAVERLVNFTRAR